jgi:hypothetical protein
MPPRKRKLVAAATEPVAPPQGLKKAKVERNGNTKPDAAWLDHVADQLFLPEESERPDGFLYDIHYQWDGYADDLDISFFEQFRRNPALPFCNGTAYVRDESGMYVIDNDWERLRRPCLGRVGKGTTVCHAHGSKIPVVLAAAKARLANASDVVAQRLINLTATTDELNRLVRPQDRLVAIQAVLDRAGIKGGVEVELTGTGFERVLGDLFGAEVSDGTDD